MGPKEIKRIRDRLPLTQAKFAGLLGVSSALVARWETGDRLPNPAHLRLLLLLQDAPTEKRIQSIRFPYEYWKKDPQDVFLYLVGGGMRP